MESEENKEVIIEKEKPTMDMISMYFSIRQKINNSTDSYGNYELMIESISVGNSLINDEELKRRISEFLQDEKNYPKITDMELQGNNSYSIGSGTSGTITVRPEDLSTGRQHLLDQQCNNIIPKLRILDNSVMACMVKEGILPRQSISEFYKKKLMELVKDGI